MSASIGVYKYDPEELRTHVVQGGAEQFAAGLIAALKPKIHCALCEQTSGYNRWAYILFAKVAKLAQADTMVLVALMGQFGVKTEAELKQLVDLGRQLERLHRDGVSPEDVIEEAMEALRYGLRERPDLRPGILARLGSVAEVEANGVSG